MDNIYNIPIFKSLPSLVNFNNSNDNYFKELNKISIKDIYENEPFINNNKTEYFLLILFIVILIIYIYFLFNYCKKI